MATQENEPYPIDQNSYRFNVMYQLRLVELNRAQLYKENEKQVLATLLKSCRDVNGNKLRSIMDSIFNLSLQPIPSRPTITINRVSSTSTSTETTALTSEATTLPKETATLTSETPNTSIGRDVEQNGDTSTDHAQPINDKQDETYSSIIERQLFDPKMSKVKVKIKLHRKPEPKAASPNKAVLDKEHNSSLENPAHLTIQRKRRKTSKRSYK